MTLADGPVPPVDQNGRAHFRLPLSSLPKRSPTMRYRLFSLLAALVVLSSATASAGEVVDMSGRQVSLTDRPARVFAAMSTTTTLVLSVAPERLIGTYLGSNSKADRFLPAGALGKPLMEVAGVQTIDIEKVAQAKPDVAISLAVPGIGDRFRGDMARIGVPVFEVKAERLEDYPAAFRSLSTLLGEAERAEAWAALLERRLAELKAARDAIPAAARRRVYYAESPNGMTTQCANAARAEVLALGGAINTVPCSGPTGMAFTTTIDPEMLLLLDPDIIVARFPQARTAFMTDTRFQKLRAVREGRIFVIPDLPFNWFDRPPSHFRLLGAIWLMDCLYPDRTKPDLAATTREFMRLFLARDLSADELAN
ncbi:periplasmic binding protein [Rhodomicrobium vannielii ATCC 17100]|uniref:Periplasmic binding protein n=2 Tax=Rhodomicrobium vannielii TaxID=1069 RepID=E3HYN3_RHOVT|nr:periplasmic binding protein [Rhodomicrobium vannielii ATCC 17100]